MITKDNYFKHIEKLGTENLPQELGNVHQVIASTTGNGQDWSLIESDKELKAASDLAFQKLEDLVSTDESLSGTADKNRKAMRKHKAEFEFLNRFIELHGSFFMAPTKIELIIDDLQAAIRKKKIRKTSPFADEIMFIQNQLLKIYKNLDMRGTNIYHSQKTFKKIWKAIDKIEELNNLDKGHRSKRDIKEEPLSGDDSLEGFHASAKQKFKEERQFIRRYLALDGKRFLIKNLVLFIDDLQQSIRKKKIRKSSPAAEEIMFIQRELLKAYSEYEDHAIVINIDKETALMLIRAIDKIEYMNTVETGPKHKKKIDEVPLSGIRQEDGTICSTDFVKQKFEKIGFKDKWLDFIGDPRPGFTAMVFGWPKMGKSYLCVEFAGYLARNHGKVLYVAIEEGLDDELKTKLEDTNVVHPNLDVIERLPADLSKYAFIFLDSVTKLKLTPEDIDKLEKKYPRISFIYVFQVRKDGQVRGRNDFKHNVDVVIEVPEKGKAIQYGRYNQGGEMRIFEAAVAQEQQPALAGIEEEDMEGIFRRKPKPKRLAASFKGRVLYKGERKIDEMVEHFMKFLESVKEEAQIEKHIEKIQKKLKKKSSTESWWDILYNDIEPLLDKIAPIGSDFGAQEVATYGFWEGKDDLKGLNGKSKAPRPRQLPDHYIGLSLSEGTLKQEDLIERCMNFLDSVKEETFIKLRLSEVIIELQQAKDDETRGFVLRETIIPLLNSIAPNGSYFGAHIGDQSHFGFWRYDDANHFVGELSKKKSNGAFLKKYDDGPDDLNPRMLFSGIATAMLVEILEGKIDLSYLVRLELADRGLDKKGKWIGFDAAAKTHGIKKERDGKTDGLSGADINEEKNAA